MASTHSGVLWQAMLGFSTKLCAVFPELSKFFKCSRNLSVSWQAYSVSLKIETVYLFYKLRNKCQIKHHACWGYFVRKFIRGKTLTHSCPEQIAGGRSVDSKQPKQKWKKLSKRFDFDLILKKSEKSTDTVLEWTRYFKHDASETKWTICRRINIVNISRYQLYLPRKMRAESSEN